MIDVGLVLEGGGMRGLYTAGVLEFFMEQDLYFPYVIGVSAGACMAASYLSRQVGRNKEVNIGLVRDPRFLSPFNLISRRELFGMDFLFDEIPNKIVPFDFETFLQGKEEFVVVTTDCDTGHASYFSKTEHGDHMMELIRASSSLPFIARSVEYEGRFLLDGGLADPIPIQKAHQDGLQKNVIIMTGANNRLIKKSKLHALFKYFYKRHPKIASLLEKQHEIYEKTFSFIETEIKRGNLFVIQPSSSAVVSRIERNQDTLSSLYELGYHDAKNQFSKLKQFLRF